MIIGVVRAVTIDFLFSGNGERAFSAPYHPGIGKSACFSGASRAPKNLLNALELRNRYYRRMPTGEDLALRFQQASIERIAKNFVYGAESDWPAANAFTSHCTKTPFLRRNFPDGSRRICSG